MRPKYILVALIALLPLVASSAHALPEITVSWEYSYPERFYADGAPLTIPLVGVVDTTAFVYAVDAHCNGQTANWGKNMNFPDDSGDGFDDVDNLSAFWHSFFYCCEYYDLNLVRLGANDAWATELVYSAWVDHEAEFYEVIDAMLLEADRHGVYVELTLAGSQEYPAYDFEGTSEIWDYTHTPGTAYYNYWQYAKDVITTVDDMDNASALFAFDAWNEPDHNSINTNYWGGDQEEFLDWAQYLANDLTPLTTKLVDLGTAGVADLWDWNFESFYNCTGGNGFDICHWHYYASAEDDYLVTDPLGWNASVYKPLFVGEVANNSGDLHRWTWYEETFFANGGMALCHMVLDGTDDYPFTGEIPPHEPIPEPEPEPEPEPDEGAAATLTMGEWTMYATVGFIFAAMLIVWQSSRRS